MRVYPYAHAPRLPDLELVDPRELVSGEGPVELEIGPGRGGFLLERVALDPAVRILGFEIKRKWSTLVDDQLRERGYGARARVFCEDIRAVLPRFVTASVGVAYVHFPDPWWKKRHAKRLVLSDTVLPELCRVLAPGGQLFVQTDVEERAQAYERLLSAAPELTPLGASPWVDENPFGARSPRERRAIADQLPIHRLLYRRR